MAVAAAVDEAQVILSVEAASVRLRFDVWLDNDEAAQTVATGLAGQLTSAATASSLLGVTVEASPLLFVSGQLLRAEQSPPSPPPNDGATAASPPIAPGLESIESALSSEEGEEDGHGVPLLLAGGFALVAALVALGMACVVLRRAKRARSGPMGWPGGIVASAAMPTAVAARVEDLPPLVAPPVAVGTAQGGIIQAVPVGQTGPSSYLPPAYARLASRESMDSKMDSPAGPSVELQPSKVQPAVLPSPSDGKAPCPSPLIAHV